MAFYSCKLNMKVPTQKKYLEKVFQTSPNFDAKKKYDDGYRVVAEFKDKKITFFWGELDPATKKINKIKVRQANARTGIEEAINVPVILAIVSRAQTILGHAGNTYDSKYSPDLTPGELQNFESKYKTIDSDQLTADNVKDMKQEIQFKVQDDDSCDDVELNAQRYFVCKTMCGRDGELIAAMGRLFAENPTLLPQCFTDIASDYEKAVKKKDASFDVAFQVRQHLNGPKTCYGKGFEGSNGSLSLTLKDGLWADYSKCETYKKKATGGKGTKKDDVPDEKKMPDNERFMTQEWDPSHIITKVCKQFPERTYKYIKAVGLDMCEITDDVTLRSLNYPIIGAVFRPGMYVNQYKDWAMDYKIVDSQVQVIYKGVDFSASQRQAVIDWKSTGVVPVIRYAKDSASFNLSKCEEEDDEQEENHFITQNKRKADEIADAFPIVNAVDTNLGAKDEPTVKPKKSRKEAV